MGLLRRTVLRFHRRYSERPAYRELVSRLSSKIAYVWSWRSPVGERLAQRGRGFARWVDERGVLGDGSRRDVKGNLRTGLGSGVFGFRVVWFSFVELGG